VPCDVTRPQDRQTVVDVALDRYGACSSATCCPRGPTSSTPTVPRRARRPRAPVDLGGTRMGMLFGATTELLTEIAPTALLSPSRVKGQLVVPVLGQVVVPTRWPFSAG
jgi:hypothetical protein